jgi:polysaccharide export outer membrane protein
MKQKNSCLKSVRQYRHHFFYNQFLKKKIGYFVFFCFLILNGCASNHFPLLETVKVEEPTIQYHIESGDTLLISVWDNPNLTQTVLVRPDGYISLPLLKEVKVQGLSMDELNQYLVKNYKKYVKTPVVTAMLVQVNNQSLNQIRIIGEATSPQSIHYQSGMTLLDLMIKAGGLSDYAAGNRAVLIREAEKNKQYRVRLDDLIRKGDMSANAPVYPGDVLTIPQAWF